MVTFDSNVLVYALDRTFPRQHNIARNLLLRAHRTGCVLTLQSLAESFNALKRKSRMPEPQIEHGINALSRRFPIVTADRTALVAAMRAVIDHKLAFWDAMLWATAVEAGCRMIVSEDFQPDRTLGPIVFRNPFGAKLPADLDAALAKA